MKSLSEIQSQKISKFCQRGGELLIFSLVFLLPIFFLPFTLDTLDFNKYIILAAFVSITTLLWLVKVLISSKPIIAFNLLDIATLLFLLLYGLSTVLSQWPEGSLWGLPLNVSQGFLPLFYFTLLYFLISNLFTKKESIFWLFFLFIVSSTLAVLISILQIFGKFIFPWDFTKTISFNTVGDLSSISIFAAFVLPLSISLIFNTEKKWQRSLLFISILSFLVLIFLVNFPTSWVILIFGTLVLFSFGILEFQKKGKTYLVWMPIIILIFSLLFLIFKFSPVPIPLEVSISINAELEIAKQALPKNVFFGTGPTTFLFSYLKFKPPEINKTIFWNTRFTSGASEILDRLISSGISGVLFLLFIFGISFWQILKYLKNNVDFSKKYKEYLLPLGIFASFLGVVLANFFYTSNIVFLSFFWILVSAISIFSLKTKKLSLKKGSVVTIIFSTFIFLILISLSFINLKYYLGEIRYLSGIQNLNNRRLEEAIAYIEKAIELNPSSDRNFRVLAQLHLAKLNRDLNEGTLSADEIGISVRNILDHSRRTTDISSVNADNWILQGVIYKNLIGFIDGADFWALESFQKASELDPQNPSIFTELGNVYRKKSDIFTELDNQEEAVKNLNLAIDNFQKAIELKSDYAPAHFQRAMSYVKEGNIRDAIELLERTKSIAPLDTGLALQLGILYYHNEQLDFARSELERAILLDENYSNARYLLGIIYDKQGEKNKAIEQFEKIAQLNPESSEVKQILNNLREGKPALEEIELLQPLNEEDSIEITP